MQNSKAKTLRQLDNMQREACLAVITMDGNAITAETTGTIGIGTSSAAGNINIGTESTARTMTIGANTTTLDIDAAGITIDGSSLYSELY